MATVEKFRKALRITADGFEDIEGYDDMCLEKDGKLHIDGVIYEILHGYWGWDSLYNKIEVIVNEWVKENGGDYYEWETSSILIAQT